MGTKYKVLKLRLGIIVERTAPVDLGAEVRRVVFVNENVLWVRIIALHTRTFVLEKGHKRCAGADTTFVQQGNCVGKVHLVTPAVGVNATVLVDVLGQCHVSGLLEEPNTAGVKAAPITREHLYVVDLVWVRRVPLLGCQRLAPATHLCLLPLEAALGVPFLVPDHEHSFVAIHLGERIRDVATGPDGAVYLLTDSADGRILRILP